MDLYESKEGIVQYHDCVIKILSHLMLRTVVFLTLSKMYDHIYIIHHLLLMNLLKNYNESKMQL